MSKAKDRARAESGIIFRNGEYVNKEEWYKAHPTKEMILAQRRPIEDEPEDILAEEREMSDPPDYFCTKCDHTHKAGTKIHWAHRNYDKEV